MTLSSLCCFSFRVSSVATKVGNARSVRDFSSRFFVCWTMSLVSMSLRIVKKILIDPEDNFPRNSRIVEILHLQVLLNVFKVVFHCSRVESMFCTFLFDYWA